jgi:hypothetical protein
VEGKEEEQAHDHHSLNRGGGQVGEALGGNRARQFHGDEL